MKSFFSPHEITEGLVSSGIKKASRSTEKLLLLGFLAGCYISLAAHLATVISTGWNIGGEPVFYGLKKIPFRSCIQRRAYAGTDSGSRTVYRQLPDARSPDGKTNKL